MGEQNRHFTLVVVGDNHSELVRKYDKKLKVEPYVVYRFEDAEKMYNKKLLILKSLINQVDGNDDRKEFFTEEYNYYSGIDYLEFYTEITEGLDIDEKTGDAYSTENPDGKYDSARVAGVFALPLIDKDGNETYSCRKGDVRWEEVHLKGTELYEAAWDTVMEGKVPENDNERTIYENMKNRKAYFEFYGTRDNYVKSSTSFWGFAFLSERTGWVELEDTVSQVEWVTNFYERFMEPLSDDEKITIYECIREDN